MSSLEAFFFTLGAEILRIVGAVHNDMANFCFNLMTQLLISSSAKLSKPLLEHPSMENESGLLKKEVVGKRRVCGDLSL